VDRAFPNALIEATAGPSPEGAFAGVVVGVISSLLSGL
jgi:hypothetical protein